MPNSNGHALLCLDVWCLFFLVNPQIWKGNFLHEKLAWWLRVRVRSSWGVALCWPGEAHDGATAHPGMNFSIVGVTVCCLNWAAAFPPPRRTSRLKPPPMTPYLRVCYISCRVSTHLHPKLASKSWKTSSPNFRRDTSHWRATSHTGNRLFFWSMHCRTYMGQRFRPT